MDEYFLLSRYPGTELVVDYFYYSIQLRLPSPTFWLKDYQQQKTELIFLWRQLN